ncbi:MAG: molybdopterin dinucleotide binding domain-containing protein, partial [Fusobacteriaceae bacterium]
IQENPLQNSAEFPYILNTGRGTVGQWHTHTRTREIQYVEELVPTKAYIYINIELARELNIKNQESILVSSINGNSAIFVANVTTHVSKEQLYAPIHYIETNKLTPAIYDTYSKEPSYKTTPINISKII